MENKYSYVSLITTNVYLPPFITMLYSFLQTKPKYPMLVLVSREISEENRAIIKGFGVDILEVPLLKPAGIDISQTNYNNLDIPTFHPCLSKLHIFNLTQFDKVIYIDGDMLLLQNIDELFDAPDLSAVPDLGWVKNCKQFNAGLMVVKPDKARFQQLLDIIQTYSGQQSWLDAVGNMVNNLDDQQVLYKLFTDWPTKQELHLSSVYNMQINYLQRSPIFPEIFKKIKVLHMSCSIRPWLYETPDEFGKDCSKWLSFNAFAIYNWYGQLINGCIQLLINLGYKSENLKKLSSIFY